MRTEIGHFTPFPRLEFEFLTNLSWLSTDVIFHDFFSWISRKIYSKPRRMRINTMIFHFF